MDAAVVGIGDVEISGGVDGDAVRIVELAIATAICAELREILAIRREFLDAVVVGVGNINIAYIIYGYSRWVVELTVAVASCTK